MSAFFLLAIVQGFVIGISRTFYGRLSENIGPFKASVSAHIVGFVFLTIAIPLVGEKFLYVGLTLPGYAYLGGVFGAFFVVVSSYVFPRIGAMNAALFVISGQMITAVFLDWHRYDVTPDLIRWIGICIILLGIYLSRFKASEEPKETQNECDNIELTR